VWACKRAKSRDPNSTAGRGHRARRRTFGEEQGPQQYRRGHRARRRTFALGSQFNNGTPPEKPSSPWPGSSAWVHQRRPWCPRPSPRPAATRTRPPASRAGALSSTSGTSRTGSRTGPRCRSCPTRRRTTRRSLATPPTAAPRAPPAPHPTHAPGLPQTVGDILGEPPTICPRS
jgi:hypothetical protein